MNDAAYFEGRRAERAAANPYTPWTEEWAAWERGRRDELEEFGPFRGALLWALIAALAFALLPLSARAADFAVNPMQVRFEPGQRAAEIRIQNFDDKIVRFQVTASDCDGAVCTAATRDLVFFPRALELAPGASRIVRVGVRSLSPHERRFAVQLRQVELADEPVDGKASGARIRMLLNVHVGVIVPPAR